MGIQIRIQALPWRIEEDSQKSRGRAEVGLVFLGGRGAKERDSGLQTELSQAEREGIKDTEVPCLFG